MRGAIQKLTIGTYKDSDYEKGLKKVLLKLLSILQVIL
jgi:hypothetical protein